MLKIGDKVRAKSNYRDEQLNEFAPSTTQTVTETKDVSHLIGTSGLWVKTNLENDWIDAGWFLKITECPHCKGTGILCHE